MKTSTLRRYVALFGYVSLLAAGTAFAQVGPIQPVLVLVDGKPENPQNRPDFGDDFTVPMDVYVGADGSVTNAVVSESSGNTDADALASTYMRTRKFLPALDARGQTTESMVRVTVNMFKRGGKKVVRVTLKPPPITAETDRVRKLSCADFLFELNRMQDQANIRDASYEVMPYVSARMYMQQKNVASEVEDKFWDQWPDTLRKVINRCEKDTTKHYYTEVLVPSLDGVIPTRETETAKAH